MALGLALADDLAQQVLQILHIIMLEHPNLCPAEPDTHTDGRMVELVRDDQAPFTHKRRNHRGITRKTHRSDQRVLRADEPRNKPLRLDMHLQRPSFIPAPQTAQAKLLDSRLDRVGAPTTGLCEPEVVVRRDVERARDAARVVVRVVVVGCDAVEDVDRASGDARDGVRETVVHAGLQPARVE